MNKVGMHYKYWMKDATIPSPYTVLEYTKQIGVDVMEIPPVMVLDMSDAEKRDLKKAVADAGLTINFNGGLTPQTDIAADEQSTRRAGIEYSKRVLEAIGFCGGVNWSGINYSAWLRRPPGYLTPEEKACVMELSVGSMRQIIKTAEDNGVTYGYEIVNRFEQFLLNTAAEGVAYCEAVGSPNAGILLDTYHMNIEEDSITAAIAYAVAKGRMSHFHVGESNRRIVGSAVGHIDWQAIFDTIKASGYDRFISMESFVRMGNNEVCVWRDLVSDTSDEALIAEAARGVRFVRDMLS